MKRLWISTRLDELKKSKSGLGKAMGLPPPRVTDLIDGKRDVHIEELGPMATYLGMDVETLLSVLTRKQRKILFKQPLLEVRGRVRAGDWREAYEWPPDDRYQVPMPIPARYKSNQVFGLEVGGDSMDEVYPEGAVLLCVPILEYPDPLVTGNRVIVQRRRSNSEIEATVKELVDDGDKRWLIARSKNPIHRAPIIFSKTDLKTEGAEVIAVVVGYFVDETRQVR